VGPPRQRLRNQASVRIRGRCLGHAAPENDGTGPRDRWRGRKQARSCACAASPTDRRAPRHSDTERRATQVERELGRLSEVAQLGRVVE
jgi:hypothetical protein